MPQQPSVASFFNTRKRAADEEINAINNKVFLESIGDAEKCVLSKKSVVCPRFINVDQNEISFKTIPSTNENSTNKNDLFQYYSTVPKQLQDKAINDDDQMVIKTRSGRTIKRTGFSIVDNQTKPQQNDEPTKVQAKLVNFVKKGNLSPRKKLTPRKETTQAFESKNINAERGEITPVKQVVKSTNETLNNLVRKELNFDEVKTKVSRSAKLEELKASLARIRDLEKTRKLQEEKNKRMKNGDYEKDTKKSGLALKEFKTIELEVLTSPRKGLSTPTKLVPPAPDKNGLMSPKRTATPKRVLFSPSKDGSPSKIILPPAYQRFLNLTESAKTTTLQLPYKYRFLFEIFKSLDSVVAMFFNRKEVITFKKLKPGVQRMLRKNFYESHLAQIKHLWPDAFNFHQMKMRNYGSISKQDYFQLVITPNIDGVQKLTKIDEENVLASAESSAMNPHMMIERQQKFQNILLAKVKDEHSNFLKSLDPPIEIKHESIRRWHPEFDLENCPEIELAHMPQPPNIEKYSSAKDILSTARNLFNCATPMERVMDRYESKSLEEKNELLQNNVATSTTKESTPEPAIASILKGVPKSLLEKIRAKQAAKALDAMTRRPSQDKEAAKFSRLPELARFLRNVFVTERKGVLPMEMVIKKIENSYRTNLTQNEIEIHLQMIAKHCPNWIVFHDIRKTVYLKLTRDLNLGEIIEKLENLANEKLK